MQRNIVTQAALAIPRATKFGTEGPNRYKDLDWAGMIEFQVYPHHSDVDWEEYVEWVSRRYGDEWFQTIGEEE